MATIFDAYGQPYTPPRRPEEREVAVTGIRDRWSTYPTSGLTPERLATIFKTADQGDVYRQAELFEEIEEKDLHIGSIFQTRRLAVSGCSLEVTPFSESAEDKKIAEFVAEAVTWIENWDDALTDLLDAIGKGFSVSEIMWEIAENKAWIRELKWVHQKRFTFYDADKTLEYPRLLTDMDPVRGEPLMPNKFIFSRFRARSGTASRAGLMRPCAWMYLFKNYGIKDWVVFAEVYGMPLRIGRYEPGASKEDKETLRQAVSSLGTDAAGVISKSTEIEFIESIKNAQGNIYELLVTFCNKETSKAVLGQTATTEGTPGALGSEKARSDVRDDLKQSDAKALAKILRMQLVRPLVGFNFGWDKSLPNVQLQHEKAEDLQATATTYKTLTEAGFKGIPTAHVHEKFSIPVPAEGDETLQPPAVGGFGFDVGAGAVPGPTRRAAEEEAVELEVTQATVLNGAQVTAATAIVKSVTIGELPRDAGLGQLQVLFNLSADQAEQMMGSAGKPDIPTTPNPVPTKEPAKEEPQLAAAALKRKIVLADKTQTDPLDGWTDKAIDEAGETLGDWLDPIRKVILSGGSLEEIRSGLLEAYPQLKPREMGNLMQKAFALSELLGRSEVKNG